MSFYFLSYKKRIGLILAGLFLYHPQITLTQRIQKFRASRSKNTEEYRDIPKDFYKGAAEIFGLLRIGYLGMVLMPILTLPFPVLAVIYQPGETLNPSCAPTDATCGVATGGNIIPGADNAYDLGSSSRQWRDLYISNNSLHIGGLALSNQNGSLSWSGSSIGATPSASSTSEFKLSELAGNGANYVGFKGPGNITANILWTLPSADGASGQTFSTDGSGVLSWVSREPAIATGTTTQYYRGDKTFRTLDTSVVPENGNVYYTDTRFDNRFGAKTTTNLAEGSNFYYTDARARNALSSNAPALSYSTTTGAFSLAVASATQDGIVSTTTQTISGAKTFSDSAIFNGNVTAGTSTLFVNAGSDRVGIGTNNPTHQIEAVLRGDDNILIDARTNPRQYTLGGMRFEHTAGIAGTRSISIDLNSNGFDDTKGIEIYHNLNGSTNTINPKGITFQADVTNAQNYHLNFLQFSKTGDVHSSARIDAIDTATGIAPIHQHSGGEVVIEQAWKYEAGAYIDITSALASGATNVQLFKNNNDYAYVGQSASFGYTAFNLAIVASGLGTQPTFEYSKGAGVWGVLAVTDGTNAFRQNGSIVFSVPVDWATDTVNGVSKNWIRIKRTRATLTTPPTESTAKVPASVEYKWGENGDLNIAGLTVDTNTFFVDRVNDRVGIGTTTPKYLLAMGIGGGYYNQSTGAWVNGSDRAYKDDILDLTKYGLETVKGLRPVSYIVKQSSVPQIGFIAQEVKEIVPEIVSGEDGSMGINYGGLTPILVKAVQEIASLGDSFKHALVVWCRGHGKRNR